MTDISKALCFLAGLGLAACASAPAVSDGGGMATEPAPAAQPQAAEPTEETMPAVGTLSFSEAQADRGRNVFRSACTECHNSSEFSDRQFKFKWRRRSAGDLFGHISSTMPEDAPASLSAQAYVDVVAYILRMNGFEAGSGELPADEATLDTLSLAPIGN